MGNTLARTVCNRAFDARESERGPHDADYNNVCVGNQNTVAVRERVWVQVHFPTVDKAKGRGMREQS